MTRLQNAGKAQWCEDAVLVLALAMTLALTLTVSSCDPIENPPVGYTETDSARFSAEVQPILVRDCAFLGCHGREGMPLTLYAVDYLRLRDPEGLVDPARPTLDEFALSGAEIDHNFRAMAARSSEDDPGGERVILRLLPGDAGGIPHADVVVYQSEDDPSIAVLRAFFERTNAP